MAEEIRAKLLISACLVGEKCRYDGNDNRLSYLLSLEERFNLFPICPEKEGALSTPRLVAELQSPAHLILKNLGKVRRIDGFDLTEAFLKGAETALRLCQKEKIYMALLKERSPSCGVKQIYDGTFSGRIISGEGLTTAMLRQEGIQCHSSDDTEILRHGDKNA